MLYGPDVREWGGEGCLTNGRCQTGGVQKVSFWSDVFDGWSLIITEQVMLFDYSEIGIFIYSVEIL